MQSVPIINFLVSNLYRHNNKNNMETVHETITRLKFIGMIKKGEKIDTQNIGIQHTSWFTSLLRRFYQETRLTTLQFLTTTVDRSFEIIQLSLTSTKMDKILCKHLIDDLIASNIGLTNIQSTYSDDRFFVCRIQTLIQDIEKNLNTLNLSFPELFSDFDVRDINELKCQDI